MKGLALMNQKKLIVAAALMSLAGCKGATGAKGVAGPEGPSGPVGPVGVSPVIESIYPESGTPSTKIRIRGVGFSPTVADDVVVVNGTVLTVASATGTEIWASGLPAQSNSLQDGYLTVAISGEQSNAVPIHLGRPGDVLYGRAKQIGYFSAATVSADEKTAFLADEYAYDPYSGNDFAAIYQFNFESGAFSTVYSSTKLYYITAMAYGPDGKLYLGAEDWETGKSGLYRFDTAFDDSTLVALTSDTTCDIYSLSWAANGDLWMGDSCSNVHVIRKSDGQFFYRVYPANDNVIHIMHTPTGVFVVDNSYITQIDGALPNSNQLNSGYFGTMGAATDDGTNLFILRRNATTSLRKVTQGFDSQTLLSNGVFGNSSFVSSGSDGHFMIRLKNGDTWFSAGYASLLNKVTASGQVTQELFSPYQSYYYAAIIGDATFYSSGYGCNSGVGSPILRQELDGTNTVVAKDFCGYANFAVANGKLYGADPRGWVLEVDPAAGTSAVVSTNPGLGIASAFATDGTSLFVAQLNTAGNYNIAKIGFGDAAQVNPNFVENLTVQPQAMQVIGDTLYWVDGGAKAIPVAGGAVTDALDPLLGFTNLYTIGLDMAGAPVFGDNNGAYGVDANGVVRVVVSYGVSNTVPDPFGTLAGISNNDGLRAQVLQ